MTTRSYADLARAAFTFPSIDNHAHPLLKAENRSAIPFEGLISEAEDDALTQDAIHTLACFRATAQLSQLFGLTHDNPTWGDVKTARDELDYNDLCKLCLAPTGIQCILIDDGLGGVDQLAESYTWHDRFTRSPTKRIVRVEILAQDILAELFQPLLSTPAVTAMPILQSFTIEFRSKLTTCGNSLEVAGFKSIVCYRTGLDVSTGDIPQNINSALLDVFDMYKEKGFIRLAHKALNDYIVRMALAVAGLCGKPVQFHTGLGDNDICLTRSSPSHLQSIIKAYPNTIFVLLHASYPFTRETGYLTAVYKNVYLDFGEVFPLVSGEGQRAIVRQVLELCSTNKMMWSTDGHWWPESYYLGTVQARETLYDVLSESVYRRELTESQAVGVVQSALFHNANRVYNLGLEPHISSNIGYLGMSLSP